MGHRPTVKPSVQMLIGGDEIKIKDEKNKSWKDLRSSIRGYEETLDNIFFQSQPYKKKTNRLYEDFESSLKES